MSPSARGIHERASTVPPEGAGGTTPPAPGHSLGRLTRLAARAVHGAGAFVVLVEGGTPVLRDATWSDDGARASAAELLHLARQVLADGSPTALVDLTTGHGAAETAGARPVVAFLGAPIASPRGELLGVLGVLDRVRRRWGEGDLAMLEDLAATAATELELWREAREVRRAQEELGRAQAERMAILNRVTDACFALDRAWRWVYLNERARDYMIRLTGGRVRDFVGRVIWDVLPEFVSSTFWGEYHRAVTDQAPVAFVEPCPLTGKWLEVRAFPDAQGLSVFFRDVTARRLVDEENARLVAELRDEDQRKDEFLAMLAHELRNPLAPLTMALDLFERAGREPRAQERYLDMARRQVRRLTRLVDDLLDVSRITRGKIELRLRALALGDTIQRAVETVAPLLLEHRHALELALPEAPIWVRGDRDRLEQVFANLLGNAAKYTDPGGRIAVRAAVVDGRAMVRVRDDGQGIPRELLPHVFDLFVQAGRPLHRSDGGLGVGLTVVRGLVEMHGGEVTAHSDGPGQGSEFTVVLPVGEHAAVVDGEREGLESPVATARRRVLVVDDNVDAAAALADAARCLGHSVRVAHEGLAALQEVSAFRPEVVLLDIGLPGLDGYELARRIRQVAQDVRLVAVTGYGQDTDRARSREAGIEQHHAKPIRLDDLRRALG